MPKKNKKKYVKDQNNTYGYGTVGNNSGNGPQVQRAQVVNPAFNVLAENGISAGNFRAGLQISYTELENMYNGGSDLATTIIDLPVTESLRFWRQFTHPDPNVVYKIEEAEKYYNIKEVVANALKNERLYGGSVVIPIFNDEPAPEELREPQNFDDIKEGSIASFRHLDRWSIYKVISDLFNPLATNFLAPNYMILAYGGQPIHMSRLVTLKGEYVPIRLYQSNNWWGKSILQDLYQLLLSVATIERVVCDLSKKATFDVIKYDGLKKVVSDPTGMINLQSKMAAINFFQSTFKTTVIDANDDYIHFENNFKGYKEILDYLIKRVSGRSGIPITKLLGEQQKGMNSSGNAENDEKNFIATVEIYQTNKIEPVLNGIDEFMLRSLFGDQYQSIIKDLEWEFVKPKFEDEVQESEQKTQSLDRILAALEAKLISSSQAKKELIAEEIFNDLAASTEEKPQHIEEESKSEVVNKGNWE